MSFRRLMAGVAVLGGLASVARGTSLPESYPLGEASTEPAAVDANLEEWLAQHVEQPSPFELDDAKFDEYVAKQDQVTALYLKLAKLNTEPSAQGPRPVIDQTLALLASDLDASKSETLNHPLLPFLYLEMLKAGVLTPEERQKTLAAFTQTSAGTCASKQRVYEELNRDNMTSLSDDGLRDLLARIDGYRSPNFKKNALRRFLGALPEARQKAVSDRALAMAQPYPGVIKQVPWLSKLAERTGKTGETPEPYASFDQARQLAGKRLCSKAKEVLTGALAALKKKNDTLDDAVTSAKAIDGCYRARDPQLRAEFWKNLTKQMTDTYGFDGWAEAKLRLGFIYWSHNDFDEAKPLFLEVTEKTEGKYKKYEARAVYALARIAEQEADPAHAADLYKDYLTRFPDQENFEEALMALVLIRADKGEWDSALAPLESLITAQTALDPDQRSTSALSFALFWAGRVYLEQNRLKEAGEMWRRVASEYYSTYYGAIGHYMLEKLTGRRLVLQPARTPAFRMHALREAFAPQDRQKVRRVEALMRLGLKSEAVCELEEIDTADGKPEKLLVKAMMMHAAGHWLDAIKAYDALPRSFRNTLAPGFERILFPRRYDTEVRELAKKAEVDPDLVLAIIRQESVFNPMARSPVGAMGLMQLMPQTASVEIKRLEPAYMSAADKKLMRQRITNPMNLLVAETNLAIGVHHVRTLLEKYQSPVYVLSAYNASPAAAQRWMTTIPTKDILAFIEKIPYKETRAYVKLVLRNYFYYKRWYGDPKDTLKHLDSVASPLIAMVQHDLEQLPSAAAAVMGPPASAKAPNH